MHSFTWYIGLLVQSNLCWEVLGVRGQTGMHVVTIITDSFAMIFFACMTKLVVFLLALLPKTSSAKRKYSAVVPSKEIVMY